MDPDQVKSTPDSLRAAIVRNTGSGYTPVRHSFVQKFEAKKSRASTLAKLVRRRKRRELILYLLALTCWNPEAKYPPWPSAVWLRALNAGSGASLTWSRSSLSESWSSLVALKLVKRQRERRRSRITPLAEIGKGVYSRPDGQRPEDYYLLLPGAFWTDRWFDRLSLAGVAVLLILLKETGRTDEVHLTHSETADWYGISESTAKKGYQELLGNGLAIFRDEYIQAHYAEAGVTVRRHYSLTGDFSTAAREHARSDAAAARAKRARTARTRNKRAAVARSAS